MFLVGVLQYYVTLASFTFGLVYSIHDATCTLENWQIAYWISQFKSVLYLTIC
jgi:hypothetical protein